MKRLAFLDSLRGLAALYVVIFHATFVPTPNLKLPDLIAPTVLFGHSGVMLFFVISGFSLCLTMPRHERTGEPLLSYCVSRLFRIGPLFYVLLAFTYARDLWQFGSYAQPRVVLANAIFLFNLIPGWQGGIVWASWAIGVEMLFYAAFPLLYFRFRGLRSKSVVLLASLCLYILFRFALYHSPISTAAAAEYELWTVLHFFPIFVGGMIAFDVFALLCEHKARSLIGAGMSIVGLAGIVALIGDYLNIIAISRHQTEGIFYALLLIGLGLRPSFVVVNRVTAFCGKISYSIYLWHPPIVFALSSFYALIYATVAATAVAFCLSIVATFSIVLPLAYLSYRYVEAPGINLGDKIFAMLRGHELIRPTVRRLRFLLTFRLGRL